MDFWQISNIIGLAMSFVAMLLSIRGIMLCNKQIKDGEARIKRFDKSFFEKGEDVVLPGDPPESTILMRFPGTVTASEAMESLDRLCKKPKVPPPPPYIANAENLQPGTAENEAEILQDVDTDIKRRIKKLVVENSTTIETRNDVPPLPPITQPKVQFRDGVHSKVPPPPKLKSKKPINEY